MRSPRSASFCESVSGRSNRFRRQDMDLYAKQTETLTTGAGNAYRVVSRARWDMDPWGSGIEIYAKAYAPGGSRRWRPYKEHGGRGCPTDPVGEPRRDGLRTAAGGSAALPGLPRRRDRLRERRGELRSADVGLQPSEPVVEECFGDRVFGCPQRKA